MSAWEVVRSTQPFLNVVWAIDLSRRFLKPLLLFCVVNFRPVDAASQQFVDNDGCLRRRRPLCLPDC